MKKHTPRNPKQAGRKRVTYVTSWGETIPGLTKDSDGRWRLLGTKKRFTEPDERAAIIHAKELLGITGETAVEVTVGDVLGKNVPTSPDALDNRQADILSAIYSHEGHDDTEAGTLADLPIRFRIPDAVLWTWLRKKLLTEAKWVAEQTGIPELASLASFDIPLAPVKLATVLAIFKDKKKFSQKADLGRHAAAWQAMAKTTQADTVAELTVDCLKVWRDAVRKEYGYKSQANLFGRVRAIASYVAKEEAQHVRPLTELLARMEILKPAGTAPQDDPQPMDPAHFMRIVKQAETEGDTRMVAALWMSLNFAMYSEEVTRLKWSEINFDNGTMFTRRAKRGRCVRAAVLWPETIAALAKLGKQGDDLAILLSREGAAVSAHQIRKQYRTLRTRANVPMVKATEWASMRDGAYTAACNAPNVEERFARILAGHKATGVQDKYVARNPQIVRPACDAVRAVYVAKGKKTKAA